jgi:hypothetical protein
VEVVRFKAEVVRLKAEVVRLKPEVWHPEVQQTTIIDVSQPSFRAVS